MIDCICRIVSSRAAVAQCLGILAVVVAIGFLPALPAQVPDPAAHYTCYDVSCKSCETDISELNVTYTGSDPVTCTVDAKDLSSSEGPFTLTDAVAGTTDTLLLLGKNGGTGKIGRDVKFKIFLDQVVDGVPFSNGDEFAKIHVSCSKPIFVDMAFGENGNGFGPFTVSPQGRRLSEVKTCSCARSWSSSNS